MPSKWLLAAAGLLAAGAAHAEVLFSIPYDPTSFAGQISFTSVSDPSIYRHGYEAFSIGAGATVRSVDFVGLFYPGDSSIASFTIGIFSDSGGLPGAAIATQTYAGDGGPKPLPGAPASDLGAYAYALNLGPTSLAAGTYWLSIYAATDQYWYWGESLTGPGTGVSTTGAGFEPTNVDYAFTLNDSPVPEPTAWATMILGLAAAGAALRRRPRVVTG
jgi:hypothetical protein